MGTKFRRKKKKEIIFWIIIVWPRKKNLSVNNNYAPLKKPYKNQKYLFELMNLANG